MLKTYRIIPLVFILFLFGFTLITVSPVFAQAPWDPSMGMRHPDRPCMNRTAQNKCNHETKKCPNKEPTTSNKKGRTENAMASSCNKVEDKAIYRKEGKSMGQKEVEQMMGTHEMTKEERKQSKKEKQRTQKPSGREAPGT